MPAMSPADRLDLADTVVLGIGAMLGAGVYVGVAAGVDAAGPGVFAAIVLAGLLALETGLVLARQPAIAGGWMAGATEWVAQAFAAALLAGVFAAYLVPGAHPFVAHAIAAALIVGLAAVRVAGLKDTRPSVGAVLAVGVAGLAFLAGAALPIMERRSFPPMPAHPLLGVAKATALMYLAYGGFGHLVKMRGVLESSRTLRNAITLSVIPLGVISLLVAAAGMGTAGILFSLRPLMGTAPTLNPLSVAAAFTGQAWARWAVNIGALAACGGALFILLGDAAATTRSLAHPGEAARAADARGVAAGSWRGLVVTGATAAALAMVFSVPVLLRLAAIGMLLWGGALHVNVAMTPGRRALGVAGACMSLLLVAALLWR